MGAVYEAIDKASGQSVAVKVVTMAFADKTGERLARFQREAQSAGSIRSPHIAKVLDAGRDEHENPFLVMELLRGEDAWQLTKRLGVLPVDLCLRIAAQTCLGLQAAHAAGVVHRDIKPANLFVARAEGDHVVVKIVDFGIAKVRAGTLDQGDQPSLTSTGSILGTPHYMAPEQAKGLKTVDARADLWSVGAVLYRLLSGRTPHAHVDTIGQLVVAICTEEPPPIQELAPWVPAEAAAVVQSALRIDPRARIATADAMLDALRALLPNGFGIREDMLITLAPEQRATVASRAGSGGSTITGVSLPAEAPARSHAPALGPAYHAAEAPAAALAATVAAPTPFAGSASASASQASTSAGVAEAAPAPSAAAAWKGLRSTQVLSGPERAPVAGSPIASRGQDQPAATGAHAAASAFAASPTLTIRPPPAAGPSRAAKSAVVAAASLLAAAALLAIGAGALRMLRPPASAGSPDERAAHAGAPSAASDAPPPSSAVSAAAALPAPAPSGGGAATPAASASASADAPPGASAAAGAPEPASDAGPAPVSSGAGLPVGAPAGSVSVGGGAALRPAPLSGSAARPPGMPAPTGPGPKGTWRPAGAGLPGAPGVWERR